MFVSTIDSVFCERQILDTTSVLFDRKAFIETGSFLRQSICGVLGICTKRLHKKLPLIVNRRKKCVFKFACAKVYHLKTHDLLFQFVISCVYNALLQYTSRIAF